MPTTQTKRQTVISHHLRGEYHLSCPCGWRNTIYTSKVPTRNDWAHHAHDRSHTRTQCSTKEERVLVSDDRLQALADVWNDEAGVGPLKGGVYLCWPELAGLLDALTKEER